MDKQKDMQKDLKPEKGNGVDYYRWVGFGLEFCGVIAFFSFVGLKLDEHFGTSPWLLLAGFFVGFAGMLYLTIKDSLKKSDNNKEQ